jgi:hypothetical protein
LPETLDRAGGGSIKKGNSQNALTCRLSGANWAANSVLGIDRHNSRSNPTAAKQTPEFAQAKIDQDKLPPVVNARESRAEPIKAMMFVPAFGFVVSALGKFSLVAFARKKINSIILRLA